jgi:hypothetical protein
MIRPSSAWERLQQRWVTGEPLDERQERERLELARHELDAQRELQFYERARRFLDETSNAESRDDARFLDRLLKQANSARDPGLRLVSEVRAALRSELNTALHREPRSRRRWLLPGIAAAVALALALVARSAWRTNAVPQDAKAPAAAADIVAVCELTSVSGIVAAASERQPVVGQRLVEGATVATAEGSACLSLDGSVRVCLPSDSAVVLSSLKAADLRVEVTRGRGIVSLSKRAIGAAFSMSGNGVLATARGTIFTFELQDDRRSAEVAVLEGSVEVRRGRALALIQASSRARVSGSAPIEVLPSSDTDRAERLSWLGMAAPAPVPAPAASALPRVQPDLRRHEDGSESVSRDALFAAARAQAKLGNPQAARELYRELVALYPGPSTAAVQVVLGNLELELGTPKRALEAFEAYLASGGPLEPEALHGKMRALRALGRKSDELATIRSYLERYPEGFQAPTLKQRRADLE